MKIKIRTIFSSSIQSVCLIYKKNHSLCCISAKGKSQFIMYQDFLESHLAELSSSFLFCDNSCHDIKGHVPSLLSL